MMIIVGLIMGSVGLIMIGGCGVFVGCTMMIIVGHSMTGGCVGCMIGGAGVWLG